MNIFKKYKVKAKKFYTILFITILEIIMILWLNDWRLSPVMIPPFIQFILMFENRDLWSKMTEEEKEELTLSEEELSNFVKNIIKNKEKGLTAEEILSKILET